jgi:hypothetical protein
LVSPCLQSVAAEGTYDDEEVHVDVIEWELIQRWLGCGWRGVRLGGCSTEGVARWRTDGEVAKREMIGL